MDCPDCEAILDELLRGELPARREAEARSHLAACPSCRAKHMRRLRIAEMTAAPATTPSLKRLSWLGRVWRVLRPSGPSIAASQGTPARLGLLGRVATAPQVAMGTVMLLIVLVGLWSLPQLTRRHTPRFDASTSSESLRASHETEVSSARTAIRGNEPGMADPLGTGSEHTRSPLPAAAPSPGPQSPKAANDLETGLARFHAGEYAQAALIFSRALLGAPSAAEQATSLLYLARSERALGHCDRAVSSYATLVRAHSSRAEALPALREGVACYDRLSEPEHAQHLIEQAANTPALVAGARALSAQRAGGRKPATAPRPAATSATD